MKLKIKKAIKEDIYRDIVRVPEHHRLDTRGKLVIEGSVCKIIVAGGSSYVILRGLVETSDPVIYIDERLRNKLCLKVGDAVDFRFKTVGLLGQFLWAWSATDPAYQVAARLGSLSVVLGVLSLVLALIALKGCL